MRKFSWLRWLVFFVMVLLALEVLKKVITKINFPASYLISLIILALQSFTVFGFIYYAFFSIIFKNRVRPSRFITYFIISFLVLITSLEILFTYLLYHPANIPMALRPTYKYYYDVYNFRLMQYARNLISFDKELLYTLKPEANENFNNAEFSTTITTNKKGTRDDETSLQSPEIICLGDSFTLGWGVDQEESFPSVIEKETGMKVLNAGIPSYGTVREMLLFNRFDTSSLKYIVIQYCTNDKNENNSFIENNNKLHLTPVDTYRSLIRSYELGRKYFPGKNFLLLSQLWIKQQINKIYPLFSLTGQQYTGTLNGSEEASSFWSVYSAFRSRFKNIKIIVTDLEPYVFHDNKFLKELDLLDKEDEKNGKKNNMRFINCSKELTPADYFILDHHINASGHKKVAERLLRELK